MVAGGKDRGKGVREDGHVHIAVFKTQKDLLYSQGNPTQCSMAAWMGWEFGGEWIRVYVWPSPFTVLLKLAQHC